MRPNKLHRLYIYCRTYLRRQHHDEHPIICILISLQAYTHLEHSSRLLSSRHTLTLLPDDIHAHSTFTRPSVHTSRDTALSSFTSRMKSYVPAGPHSLSLFTRARTPTTHRDSQSPSYGKVPPPRRCRRSLPRSWFTTSVRSTAGCNIPSLCNLLKRRVPLTRYHGQVQAATALSRAVLWNGEFAQSNPRHIGETNEGRLHAVLLEEVGNFC